MVKHTQTIRRLLTTTCLGVFDHFVGLPLEGLITIILKRMFVNSQKPVGRNLLTPSVPVIWELSTIKKEVFVSYFFAPDIKFDWKVELRVTFMKFNNKKFANICWLIKKRAKFKNLGLLHKRNFEVKIFSKWANLRVRVRLLSISECYILENFV